MREGGRTHGMKIDCVSKQNSPINGLYLGPLTSERPPLLKALNTSSVRRKRKKIKAKKKAQIYKP